MNEKLIFIEIKNLERIILKMLFTSDRLPYLVNMNIVLGIEKFRISQKLNIASRLSKWQKFQVNSKKMVTIAL